MEQPDEVNVSGTIAGQQMVLHGPAAVVVIAILLAGWFGFAWIVYDGIKQMGMQHHRTAEMVTSAVMLQNADRKREHDEITRQLATLTCVLALGEKEKGRSDRFELCVQQWRRAVLMVPG